MNLNPTHIIRQNSTGPEQKLIAHAALLLDIPTVTTSFDQLETKQQILQIGTALPVGSVEYVRKAMQLANIAEPRNLSYPESLTPYLYRDVQLKQLSEISEPCFIKPYETKQFTGFIYNPITKHYTSEHELEQICVIQKLPPETLVWTSNIVKFVCEWRYYIMNNQILGYGRYDADGEDSAPVPNIETIQQMILLLKPEYNNNVICALDVGVLNDGRTTVVEVNDAWAIGIYERALDARQYLEFLYKRWTQLQYNENMYILTLN